jgi:hypothetical protein
LVRGLVAAIDNAEAPRLPAGRKAADQHRFHDGSAEVERLSLNAAQVRAVLVAEMQERVCTAVRKPSSGAPAFVPARAA